MPTIKLFNVHFKCIGTVEITPDPATLRAVEVSHAVFDSPIRYIKRHGTENCFDEVPENATLNIRFEDVVRPPKKL